MIAQQLLSGATLVGIDRDPDAIRWNREHPVKSDAAVIVEQARFSEVIAVLDKYAVGSVDGALIDLGVSSFQIDSATRGFSFMQQCDLDMRMNSTAGMSASDLINHSSVDELADILEKYGEIRNAPRMAAAIKRAECVPQTSEQLRKCLSAEYGSDVKFKVLAKVFMALRIAVNDELSELEHFLQAIVFRMKEGARLAVISYHSLEDRIVKRFFRENEPHCICPKEALFCTCGKPGLLKRITRKAVTASPQEVNINPRSRSARLRVAEKHGEV